MLFLSTSWFWIVVCVLHACFRFMSVLILHCVLHYAAIYFFFSFKIILEYVFIYMLYPFTFFIPFCKIIQTINCFVRHAEQDMFYFIRQWFLFQYLSFYIRLMLFCYTLIPCIIAVS